MSCLKTVSGPSSDRELVAPVGLRLTTAPFKLVVNCVTYNNDKYTAIFKKQYTYGMGLCEIHQVPKFIFQQVIGMNFVAFLTGL